MTNYQKRKEKNDEYRSKIMRFTFQLSLGDTEVREWFERQPEKGAYLKDLRSYGFMPSGRFFVPVEPEHRVSMARTLSPVPLPAAPFRFTQKI